MNYYIVKGSQFVPTDKKNVDIRERLPRGNFIVKYDELHSSYFLELIDPFVEDGKIYGKIPTQVKRIMNTFNDRERSTGALFVGEKGSGKTLLARLLAIDCVNRDMPVIIVNNSHCGEIFNQFVQGIEQPAMLLFDEFEKVYTSEQQESVLTLLDGVFPSKKLFVFTSNNKYRIDEHMQNRPGRIYYLLEFGGEDREFIVEYCNDKLLNQDNVSGVITVSELFDKFNFDMLKSLVEEMNRYSETAAQALKMLNVIPDSSRHSGFLFSMSLVDKNGNKRECDDNFYGNPLLQEEISIEDVTDEDDTTNSTYVLFRSIEHLEKKLGNKFIFKNGDGFVLTLERIHNKKFDFSHLL